MCGIVGGIALSSAGGPAAAAADSPWALRLPKGLAALHRRGPDAQGQFVEGPVALAQARLKIIDLSPAANQPMHDPSGRYVLVYNGEVFNYRALRAELEQQGVAFVSQSDTEVVLHALIHQGVAALDRLNGFFALAFYDRQAASLLLARDRYGIKPLVLHADAQRLLFASELKALLAMGIPRRLDTAAVAQYFELNYVPPDGSVFHGVERLAPGGWLRCQGGRLERGSTYCPQPRLLTDTTPVPSYEAAQARLAHLLERATALRLVADVPLGVFLSGGLDSSVVAALAVRHSPHVRSFSLRFTDPLYDETAYATAVARHLGTDHTAITVTHDTLLEHLEGVLDYLDEPFADASALNFYVLSRAVRPQVTVALTGDGADEVFGGYHKHLGLARAARRDVLNGLLRVAAPALQPLPASRNSRWGRRLVQLQRYSASLQQSPAERYWALASTGADVDALLAEVPPLAAARRAQWLAPLTPAAGLNGALVADIRLVLAGDMLVKADLMSMAHGLEVRTPYLDYDVVDFALGLPEHYKVLTTGLAGLRKRILNDAFRPLLPPELYHRSKQGFEVPLAGWFRGPLRARLERELNDHELLAHQGLFRPQGLAALWQAVRTGRNRKEEWTLWAFLVFQHIYRRHLAGA